MLCYFCTCLSGYCKALGPIPKPQNAKKSWRGFRQEIQVQEFVVQLALRLWKLPSSGKTRVCCSKGHPMVLFLTSHQWGLLAIFSHITKGWTKINGSYKDWLMVWFLPHMMECDGMVWNVYSRMLLLYRAFDKFETGHDVGLFSSLDAACPVWSSSKRIRSLEETLTELGFPGESMAVSSPGVARCLTGKARPLHKAYTSGWSSGAAADQISLEEWPCFWESKNCRSQKQTQTWGGSRVMRRSLVILLDFGSPH